MTKNDDKIESNNDSLNDQENKKNILSELPKNIAGDIINIIPSEVAKKYEMMAFEKSEGILKVAMIDLENTEALNALNFVAEKEKVTIETYEVSKENFTSLLVHYNETSEALKDALDSYKDDKDQEDAYEKNNENTKKR